jgi:hypothetical protein
MQADWACRYLARENATLSLVQAAGGLAAGAVADRLGAKLSALATADDDRYVVGYALRALARLGQPSPGSGGLSHGG